MSCINMNGTKVVRARMDAPVMSFITDAKSRSVQSFIGATEMRRDMLFVSKTGFFGLCADICWGLMHFGLSRFAYFTEQPLQRSGTKQLCSTISGHNNCRKSKA